MNAVDQGSVAVLVLLDLSAAFDTVDQAVLLKQLEYSLGVKGEALRWFHSYLTGRFQTVSIDGVTSSPHSLAYGVPQGSVLGPLLFSCYTYPLGKIIRQHGLSMHFYADDSQLYVFFKPATTEKVTAIKQLEECIAEVRTWMRRSFLKLNEEKTEVIIFGTKSKLPSVGELTIKIGDAIISPSPSAKNLGILYDQHLTMDDHVGMVCRSAYLQLHNIFHIKRFLTAEALKALIQACVLSRLDYGNSLLYGLPATTISRLQRVQNSAARLLTGTKRSEHIQPILAGLHWLPVQSRIIFKLLSLTYKALNNMAPSYLSDMLTLHEPSRSLQSVDTIQLKVPKSHLKSWGDRSFPKAAATEWNTLPLPLRKSTTLGAFTGNLKTYLYKLAYSCN